MKNKVIPYGRQHITDDDIKAVNDALLSNNLTQGPRVLEFEEKFAEYIGAKYSVAVSNGTAALHISCLALDLKEGDKIITTPITFAASANCARYCGAEVVFGDIDPKTYLLDINSVRRLLEAAPKGTYKGIIPVDFAGRPVDLELFRGLADEYDCWLLEDACHAPGAFFIDSKGEIQKSGNGNFADLSIFSFHPVKHIACGEGGMITTNNAELYEKLMRLRSHGIVKDDSQYLNPIGTIGGIDAYPAWYMEMQTLGYNYRITDFQAALGTSQLKRASWGLERRRAIAERYQKAFEGFDFVIGQSGVVDGHAYHLYVVELKDRLGVFNELRSKNIIAQIHYIPCHFMPYYRQFGWKEGDRPYAEAYYQRCISLPMYPTLTEEEQNYVINVIKQFYAEKYMYHSSERGK